MTSFLLISYVMGKSQINQSTYSLLYIIIWIISFYDFIFIIKHFINSANEIVVKIIRRFILLVLSKLIDCVRAVVQILSITCFKHTTYFFPLFRSRHFDGFFAWFEHLFDIRPCFCNGFPFSKFTCVADCFFIRATIA